MDPTVIGGIITAIGVAAGASFTGWSLIKRATAPQAYAVIVVQTVWTIVETNKLEHYFSPRVRRMVMRVIDPKGQNHPEIEDSEEADAT